MFFRINVSKNLSPRPHATKQHISDGRWQKKKKRKAGIFQKEHVMYHIVHSIFESQSRLKPIQKVSID